MWPKNVGKQKIVSKKCLVQQNVLVKEWGQKKVWSKNKFCLTKIKTLKNWVQIVWSKFDQY